MPEWRLSTFFSVTIEATKTLSDLLSHLYVVILVLDIEQHD